MTELKYFKKSRSYEELEQEGARIVQIKTDDIRPNRAQPRAEFDQNSIIRLADSIRRYGILQSLTVRRSDPDDIYRYELIAGERRLRAAKMLGYLTVPCIIMDVDEQTSAELAIIENLLREDLNMFEQAYGFKKLIENHRLTQEEVARRMSLSQSAIANKLRLLRLSYEEQRFILEAGLTERHARAALRISSQKDRSAAIHYIADNKLNVQESEKYIEELLASQGNPHDQIEEMPQLACPPEDAFKREKEMMEMVQSLQRKIDTWNRSGKSASFNVINSSRTIEITIRLSK